MTNEMMGVLALFLLLHVWNALIYLFIYSVKYLVYLLLVFLLQLPATSYSLQISLSIKPRWQAVGCSHCGERPCRAWAPCHRQRIQHCVKTHYNGDGHRWWKHGRYFGTSWSSLFRRHRADSVTSCAEWKSFVKTLLCSTGSHPRAFLRPLLQPITLPADFTD